MYIVHSKRCVGFAGMVHLVRWRMSNVPNSTSGRRYIYCWEAKKILNFVTLLHKQIRADVNGGIIIGSLCGMHSNILCVAESEPQSVCALSSHAHAHSSSIAPREDNDLLGHSHTQIFWRDPAKQFANRSQTRGERASNLPRSDVLSLLLLLVLFELQVSLALRSSNVEVFY